MDLVSSKKMKFWTNSRAFKFWGNIAEDPLLSHHILTTTVLDDRIHSDWLKFWLRSQVRIICLSLSMVTFWKELLSANHHIPGILLSQKIIMIVLSYELSRFVRYVAKIDFFFLRNFAQFITSPLNHFWVHIHEKIDPKDWIPEK